MAVGAERFSTELSSPMTSEAYTKLIKSEALRLGFSHCGISKADFLEEEAPRLERWLKQQMHGRMQYMENHFDMRLDPRLIVPGARSVISLLLNYFPAAGKKGDQDNYKISRYAYGEDYHVVIKDKLKELLSVMRDSIGDIQGRAFVDSAPVMDKAWAVKGGLGWIGKNSNLIHKKAGSFFFIAELITDLELIYDGPVSDHCGTCTRCIDACPTDAITSPYVVDGSRCISYFTIELKENIPPAFRGSWSDWIFGCDICQEVCPWNRFSLPTKEKRFHPVELPSHQDAWREITEETFCEIFRRSPLKRAGYEGLKRNIAFLDPPH
jgi:epoxyqueuosine reductase